MSFKSFFYKNQTLDKRIVEKDKEMEARIRDAVLKNRYCAFNFTTLKSALDRSRELNDYEKYEFFYDLISKYDDLCKLSSEDGEMINNLMKDPNHIAAIHRTYLGPIEYVGNIPTTNDLYSIMSEGLINNGHLSSGGYSETPSLALTTSPLTGMGDLANLFFSYKHNNLTVLLRFPKELVDRELQFVSEESQETIYDRKNKFCYIRPEYVLGAIVKGKDQDKFYTREELLSVKKQEYK